MEYCIRVATDKDKKSLLLLMKEHALYEGHSLEISKHQQMSKLESIPVTIFVVELNKKLAGYMSVIKQFSTWDMDWYLYPSHLKMLVSGRLSESWSRRICLLMVTPL